MLKILRRKPRAPMTPGQRYKNDLASLFGCGMMAMLGACLAAVAIKAAIEEGLPTVADWVVLVLVVIACIALAYVGLRAVRVIGKGLMEHAPVDRELAAETSSAPLLNTGEVRAESPDDADLQYAGRLQRHLRWKIGVLAACSACSGFGLIAAGLLTPIMISILSGRCMVPLPQFLVAGEEMPQLLWIIYGSFWGGGWVFAFMAYLQARNFVRHVAGYVPTNFMDRGINPSEDLTNLAEGGGWNNQAHDQIDYRDLNFVDREP